MGLPELNGTQWNAKKRVRVLAFTCAVHVFRIFHISYFHLLIY